MHDLCDEDMRWAAGAAGAATTPTTATGARRDTLSTYTK